MNVLSDHETAGPAPGRAPGRPGEPRPRRRLDRTWPKVGWTVAGAALFTAGAAILPVDGRAYESVVLRAVVETVATLVAVVAATLLAGRLQRTRSLADLLLVAALGLLALVNGALALTPTLTGDEVSGFATWAPAAGRLAGAALLLAAGLAPERLVRRPRPAVASVLAAAVGCSTAIAAGVALADPDASTILDAPGAALRLVTVLAFAGATAGFARRAQRQRDELFLWLAIGAALAAFAGLNHVLFPIQYSRDVYSGDVLRLAFYTALLVGLIREVATYQRRLADAAVLEERRRMARDLHDGLAQELTYLRQQSAALAGNGRTAEDHHAVAIRLVTAADRALEEARFAISTLARPTDDPFPRMLLAAAERVAARSGATVTIEADDVAVPPELAESLARVVREAVTNAVRHGGASTIALEVRDAHGLTIRVRDDGTGFDPAGRCRPDAFGLISMRERVEGAGGSFALHSLPGQGTLVEVRVP